MMLVLRNMLLILARKNERMFAALDGLANHRVTLEFRIIGGVGMIERVGHCNNY